MDQDNRERKEKHEKFRLFGSQNRDYNILFMYRVPRTAYSCFLRYIRLAFGSVYRNWLQSLFVTLLVFN